MFSSMGYHHCKLFFIVFFYLGLHFEDAHGQTVKPKLILAKRVTESSVRLQWAVPVQIYNILQRYRIQYSSDNFVSDVQEWPTQIARVNYDTNDSWFVSSRKNNYDCFNQCIQNTECIFASRLYDGFCYLKKTNTRPVDGVRFKNTEYVVIANYTNDVTIENLPYNRPYRFRVAVYGTNFTTWSEFSDASDEIDTTIRFNVTTERTGFTSVRVHWDQIGNFTNHTISRYRIKMRFNYSPDREFTPDLSSYTTFMIQPNYDDAVFILNVKPLTRQQCLYSCVNRTNCIAIVHLPDTQECYLKEKRDIQNGFIRDANHELWSLQNTARDFTIVDQIFANTSYQIQVDSQTPYGTNVTSNELVYTHTETIPRLNIYVNLYDLNANLTWSIPDNFRLRRFTIGTSKQNSSRYGYVIEYSNEDYEDPTQINVAANDLAACYEACYFNLKCVAYVWSNFSSICILKFQKISPTVCVNETVCAKIPDYKSQLTIVDHLVNTPYCYRISLQDDYGVNSLQSKANCFEFPFKVETKNYSALVEGFSSNIECVYTWINETKIRNFTWYKDNKTVDLGELDAEYTLRGRFLYFRNLNHLIHNGNYRCEIELVTDQVVSSVNSVDLLVKYEYSIRVDTMNDTEDGTARFNLTDNVLVPCIVDGYPYPKIQWKYNLLGLQYVDFKNVSQLEFPSNYTVFLNLTNVEKRYNGSYRCQTEDGKLFKNINLIIQSKPSKPNILNSYSNGNLTYINWMVDSTGDANLTSLRIEWSKNFSNFLVPMNSTFIPYQTIQNDEVRITYIPLGSSVRITVFNAVGASNTSDVKVVNSLFPSTDNNTTPIPDSSQQATAVNEPPYVLIASIAGSVLVALIIIVLVVLLIKKKDCCRRKQPTRYDSRLDILSNLKESLVYDTFEPPSQSVYEAIDAIPPPPKQYQQPSEDFSKPLTKQERSYSIESLYETWLSKLHIIDKELANEFTTITNPANLTMNEAKRVCNYEKSRYKSIYPYDLNRVVLNEKDGIEGSDFINASYIEGIHGNIKFIAAQAPTNQTVHDFLRMLCENKVKAVVMLTRLYEEESSKLKCVPYWDDKSNMRFGDMCIKVTTYEDNLTYVKRKLMITNSNYPDLVYFLDHYHYIEWPDKSVPTETQNIVSLVSRVNQEHPSTEWPIVVHCSAGVGRTGTYVALDFLLDMIMAGSEINIYEMIVFLRYQRVSLVQTWEQYKFIHLAVLEYYIFGVTSISREFCKLQLQILSRRDDATGQSNFDILYRNVVSFKDKSRTTHAYSAYRSKFSSSVFKPYDTSLIKLSVLNQDTSSMYVDAVLFKNSQIYENYIIAADPNFETIRDFLRLIFTKRISVIVSLTSQFYLPDENETIEINEVIIFNKQKIFENGITSYLLEFIDTKNSDKHTVYYFDQTSNWPLGQLAPTDRNYFISFVREVLYTINPINMKLNGIKDPLILVHSSDAGDRCAITVATCVLLKSLIVTQQFDVVKTVLSLRRTRSNLISTTEGFKFLYEICCDYANQAMDSQSSTFSDKRFSEDSTESYA